MIDHLQGLGGEGLTDSQAEIAMSCMLCIYAQHRATLQDRIAIKRMVTNELESGRLSLVELVEDDAT